MEGDTQYTQSGRGVFSSLASSVRAMQNTSNAICHLLDWFERPRLPQDRPGNTAAAIQGL